MATNEIPGGAVEVVKAFLKCTIDVPDEGKARGMLSKGSLEGGEFHMPEPSVGSGYVVGEAVEEGGQVYVPVTLKDGATGTEMTMPLAPVLEEGVWKLDMGKMMAKLMGGSVGEMVESMGAAMGEAMAGVGEAMKSGLSGMGGDEIVRGEEREVRAESEASLEKLATAMEKELSARHELELRIEVAMGAAVADAEEGDEKRLVEVVAGEVLRNFVYAVTEANRQVPLEGRVKAIRVEGVREARERVVFAEGARIIYRAAVRGENGFYDGQELATLMAGVAAGMAEVALPGEVENRPSYRPSGDGAKIVRDYREFALPALERRMAEMVGQAVAVEVEWESFEERERDAAALWLWGVNRVCGAMGLLMKEEGSREVVAEKVQSVRIRPVPQKEMKGLEVNGTELLMYISPEEGEAGAFYEGEIAEFVSGKLKLRTRPVVAELERYAKTWEKPLKELFGVGIQYAFDWDGFTCFEEQGKNAFALSLLKEHGIDAMYYALVRLAEKNPNFKQQLPERVRWIYLEHVPTAERKGVRGEQTTLALQLFLHEGYEGYLTGRELEKALPAIVAGMPDIAEEPAAEAGGGDAEDLAELEALRKEAEADAAFREWVEKGLERFSGAIGKELGKPLPAEVEWDTFECPAEMEQAALRRVLQGVAECFILAAGDKELYKAITAKVDTLVLQAGDEEAFELEGELLTFTVVEAEGKEALTAAEALELLREALGVGEKAREVEEEEEEEEAAPPEKSVEERAEAEAADMRKQFEAVVPAYAQQLSMILSKPVGFEIEWGSVTGGMAGMGQLLNAGLTPAVGGLAMLVSDGARKVQAHQLISRVVLRQTAVAGEHGFSFAAGTLTYSAMLMPGLPPMEPQLAATLLGVVLDKAQAAG